MKTKDLDDSSALHEEKKKLARVRLHICASRYLFLLAESPGSA